ncbi:hypothetical protein Bca4012_060483 [Brassica carinata]
MLGKLRLCRKHNSSEAMWPSKLLCRWIIITIIQVLTIKDNAVKNMFNENNSNEKRIFFLDGCSTPGKPNMKILWPRKQGTCSI